MARVYQDGFEFSTAAAVGKTWDVFTGSTVGTTHARSGTYGMQVASLVSGTAQGALRKWLAATASGPFFLRKYIYIVTLPSASNTIMQFNSGSGSVGSTAPRCEITLESNGTLILRNATGVQIGSASSAINDGNQHMVELKHDGTGGANLKTIEGRLDGVVFATSNTQNQGNPLAFSVGGNLSSETQTTGEWWIDDIALNDSTGSDQTGYPGSGKILTLRPNGAGDSNSWLDSSQNPGTTSNYTLVNEVVPDDGTTNIRSHTLGATDMYNVDNSGIGASDTVNVVMVGARFNDAVADAVTAFKLQIEKTSGGTISQSAAIIPNTATWNTLGTASPRNYPIILTADPDGSAWTQSTLDSMQIGATITAAGTNDAKITAIWATVDYTPSALTTPTVSSWAQPLSQPTNHYKSKIEMV